MTARATTETGAANLALGHCGQPEIADFSDSNLRARACRAFFAVTRDSLLREKWWSFAKGWDRPSADAAPSLGPLETRYVMPADCLRIRYIQDAGDEQWDIESGDVDDAGVQVKQTVLVTNVTAPLVAYTRRIELVRLWDPVFLDGFAYELAARIARRLGRTASFAQNMHQLSLQTIATATAIDSKEQSRQQVSRSTSWLDARRGYRSR